MKFDLTKLSELQERSYRYDETGLNCSRTVNGLISKVDSLWVGVKS